MTILNAFVEQRRALVAVDTYAQSPDRSQLFQASKLHYLSHLGILFACRGDAGYLLALLVLLWAEQGPADRIASEMPQIAAKALAHFAAAMSAGGKEQAADHQEIVMVYWSEPSQRIVGLGLRNDDPGGAGAFKAFDIGADYGGVYIAPWDEGLGQQHPKPDSPEAMERLMLDQVHFVTERAPESRPGGAIVMAECDRHGVRFYAARPLP